MSRSSRNARCTTKTDRDSTEDTASSVPAPEAVFSALPALEAVKSRVQALEMSLTLFAYPGNVAKIRRLITLYQREIEIWNDILPAASIAHHAAAGDIELPSMPTTRIRNDVRGITREVVHHAVEMRRIVLYAIARMEARKKRHEDVLTLRNQPKQFRAAMQKIIHQNLFV
jgi:hypothetical protein